MAENIGLKITLGGVTQVVSDIDKLKGSIDGAKKTLEGLEEGSEAFQQLSQEIEVATIALNAFEQTASQMDAPEKMGLLASAGKLVSSAFQSANESLKSFGIDTEKIGQSARRTFQSLKKPLDQVSESLQKTGEELSQIPGPIGQVAQGVKGLGQALKILLANPIIAVIAGVVAALTLLYKAFTSTKAGGEQMERVFSAISAIVDVLRDRFLKFAESVGKLFTGDLLGAVKGFRDSVSGIGTEIVKEATEAAKIKGILQQITDATRELNKERARQNVLIADAKLRINDENLSLEDRIKALNEIRNSEIKLAQQEEQLAKRRFEAIKQQNALSDSSKEALDQEAEAYVQYQQKILESKTKQKELFDQEKALRDRQRAEQKAANDARIQELVKESNLLLDRLKLETQYLGVINKLGTLDAEVIQNLNTQVQSAEKYASVRERFLTIEDRLLKVYEGLIPQQDKLGELFEGTQKLAEGYFDQLADGSVKIEDVVTGLDTFRKKQLELNKDTLSPTQQDLLTKYVDGYERILVQLDEFSKADIKPPFDLKEYEKLIIDLALLNQEISIDPFEERTPEDRAESLKNAQKLKDEVQEDFLRAFVDLKGTEILKGLTGDELQKQTDLLRQQGLVVFNNLLQSGSEIVKFEEGTTKVGIEVDKLNKKLLELSTAAKAGFVIENLGEITDTFVVDLDTVETNRERLLKLEKEINTKRFDTNKEFQIDILDLETQLKEQGLDISKFTYEEQLIILKGFLEQEVEATEEAENKKQEKRKKTLDSIKTGLSEFQGVLNSLSQLQSEFYQNQLDELERQNEEIQSKIVGNTEESIQKRLEAEKIFNEKRKQLEKQQALTTLRISFVQSLANTAEAITKAFTAGPVIGQIAAGVIAGISAVQTGLIANQIQQIQSLQRGGIIKGQGGLVVGPSHEFGGVKFQGGGIELEGGETVVNRVSSVKYNDLLNQINVSGGGRPLVQNNFDDSRIVEAIARQRSEPIRAYVLESEITNKQGINRRLEQLSSI